MISLNIKNRKIQKLKKIKVEKIVQFKSCNNEDIASAVLSLAEPLLVACGDDKEMKKNIISLAVNGWNLSLFRETEIQYKEKINKKIQESLSEEKRKVFGNYVLQIIKNKQADFGEMMKGITEHSISFNDNVPLLEVKTLPVNPKQT